MGGKSPASPKSACTVVGRPIAPSSIIASIRRTAGLQRVHMASMRNTPADRAASTSVAAEARSSVIGFSHSTARPARTQVSAAARWATCGVAT